ncbi:hypothetical protein UVI_02050990 [Ustilaginoidea virens]|uniref:Short-chain dehydrogenase n=1 Tax=Ustilaginoidea virens TaxID=1159556 RepID=A0A1B5L2D0_USTVR|nr:hypothetical protein UVI_02050990 [Ustilaginoidea virens]
MPIVPWPFLPGFLYRQLLVTPPKPSARFDDKTVIVTGANVGLGLEAARHFGRLGAARVILGVRDLDKGDAAKASIDDTLGRDPSPIHVWHLDLASYDSVRAFAARADKQLDRLDVLCENAGIATQTFRFAERDESTMTVNVTSPFLLALLLLPKMKATAGRCNTHATITFTGHQHNFVELAERHEPDVLDALSDRSRADMATRYFVSKLVGLLCVREMAQRAGSAGPVVINCLNPGFCHSQLGREAGWYLYVMALLLARPAEVGGRMIVGAAAGGPGTHGKYISDGAVAEPSAFVRSEEGGRVQRRVWDELVARLEGVVPGVAANL